MNPWTMMLLPAALVAGELLARLYFRLRFRLAFHSRRIGEYPFDLFVEELPPPLYFRFKKGFQSTGLHINSLGLRGPEPAPKGTKRRLMFLGESNIFGSRLTDERRLWSNVLGELLSGNGHGDWEVLNAGFPGYNAGQLRAWWEAELRGMEPEILIVSLGGNDISQVGVLGDAWQPGAPWPQSFIRAQQRKSPWWQKYFVSSALWFLCRRAALTVRCGFQVQGGADILRSAPYCLEQLRAIVSDAQARGIRVVLANIHPVCSPFHSALDERRLDSIQSNWREHNDVIGPAFLAWFAMYLAEAPLLGAATMDLATPFWKHPQRFSLYHDMLHLNARGHVVLAQVICERLNALGWLGKPSA